MRRVVIQTSLTKNTFNFWYGKVWYDRTDGKKSPSFITFAGLFLALLVPVFYTLIINPVLIADQTNPELEIIIGLIVMWMLAVGVVVLAIRAENRELRSIGFVWPSPKIILQALGLGIVFSLAVPLLSILTSTVLPSDEVGSIESVTQIPWWLMLFSVLTAGVTEEILFRGYTLERLFEWTDSKWLSSLISLAFFTAIHDRMEPKSYSWSRYSVRSCTDSPVLVVEKCDYGDDRAHYDQSAISIHGPR